MPQRRLDGAFDVSAPGAARDLEDVLELAHIIRVRAVDPLRLVEIELPRIKCRAVLEGAKCFEGEHGAITLVALAAVATGVVVITDAKVFRGQRMPSDQFRFLHACKCGAIVNDADARGRHHRIGERMRAPRLEIVISGAGWNEHGVESAA